MPNCRFFVDTDTIIAPMLKSRLAKSASMLVSAITGLAAREIGSNCKPSIRAIGRYGRIVP